MAMFERYAFPLVAFAGTLTGVSLELTGFSQTTCLATGVAVQFALALTLVRKPSH